MRRGAEAALLSLGDELVPRTLRWLALDECGESEWVAIERLFLSHGAESAARALERHSASWPRTCAGRLRSLYGRLSDIASGVVLKASPLLGLRPDIVELLRPWEGRSRWSSDFPVVSALESMGHTIVPTLITILRRYHDGHYGVAPNIAAYVLGKLAKEEDLPDIDSLATSGCRHMEIVETGLATVRQRVLLVESIRRGVLTPFLLSFLTSTGAASHPSVWIALEGWLRDHDAENLQMAQTVVRLLAENRAYRAIPTLNERLGAVQAGEYRVELALALLQLGDPSSIPILIESLDQPAASPSSAMERERVLTAFQDIAGRDLLKRGPLVGPEYHREVAVRLRAWWSNSRDRLAFDRDKQVWELR